MQIRITLAAIWLGLASAAFADIKEVSTMAAALSDVKPGTLVIFDIDNTLLETAQTLGSDQWVEDLIETKTQGLVKKGKAENEAKAEALNLALSDWKKVQHVTRMKPVEPSIPAKVKALQTSTPPILILALTARPVDLAETTRRQLLESDIDLSLSTVSKEEVVLATHPDDINFVSQFLRGVIHAGNNAKGEILVKFLKQVNFTPKKIVFVDDKIKNVKSVEASLDKLGVPHTSYRYGAADARVKAYNRAIADVEWKNFRILSDDEAAARTR